MNLYRSVEIATSVSLFAKDTLVGSSSAKAICNTQI